jgi:hypothetical protein
MLRGVLVPFACACGLAQSTAGKDAEAYLRAGEVLEVRGAFPAAEKLYKNALDLLKRSAGLDGLPRIAAWDDLAGCT